MEFLDIGLLEILTVLFLILVVFGPEKMVQTARTAGEYMRRARMIANQLSKQITEEFDEDTRDLKQISGDLTRELKGIQNDIEKEISSAKADESDNNKDG